MNKKFEVMKFLNELNLNRETREKIELFKNALLNVKNKVNTI
jgi:phage host-nuclease inhibitor protein Gam